MKTKTILGISFTTVFVLSALSTITAMQADSMFKIRHLPDFKSSNFVQNTSENSKISDEKILSSLDADIASSRNLVPMDQLKN